MNKKVIIIFIVVLMVGVVFAATFLYNKNEENYTTDTTLKTYSYITDDMKENMYSCSMDLCLVDEYEPKMLLKDADAVVIATVISKDNGAANEGLFGMTKGRIIVKNALYGELKEGQVVEYAKNGGIFTMAEWEKTQPEAANAKRDYLRKKEGLNIDLNKTYISVELSDDIQIEEGLTYLMYLKKYQTSYEIIGLDVGLRQVDIPKVDEVNTNQLNTADLKIKNNKTGEFESVNDYINAYINTQEL